MQKTKIAAYFCKNNCLSRSFSEWEPKRKQLINNNPTEKVFIEMYIKPGRHLLSHIFNAAPPMQVMSLFQHRQLK